MAVETSKKEDEVMGGSKTASAPATDSTAENDEVMQEADVNVNNTNKDSDGDSLMNSAKIDETLPSSDKSQKSEKIDMAGDDASIAIVTARPSIFTIQW